MLQRQHLRLVEDDNAVRKAVELAALGGAVGIQRFKELHRRRDHHGHIPVFRGKRPADIRRRCAVGKVKAHAGMVLQHIAVSQYIPKHGGVLLDDGGIGNNIDHSLHPVLHRMAQRKGHGGHRLSAPCRHGQSIDPSRSLACLHAGIQYLAAQSVQLRCRCLPRCNIRLQPCQQRWNLITPAPSALAVHE